MPEGEIDSNELTFCIRCGTKLRAAHQAYCGGCGAQMVTPDIHAELAQPTSSILSLATYASKPASHSYAEPVKRSMGILVAGACAVVALIATVLPWVQTNAGYFNMSVNAIQNAPIYLVPPGGALIAFWRLQSRCPESMTSGPVYGLRLAFGIAIVFCLIDLGGLNNANQVAGLFVGSNVVSFAVGFWAYAVASAIGLIASFAIKIPQTGQQKAPSVSLALLDHPVESPAQVAPSPAAPIDLLAQLAQLRDRGALTDAEYEGTKADILRRI